MNSSMIGAARLENALGIWSVRSAVLFGGLCLLLASSSAQRLSGTVRDEQDAPLAGVEVDISALQRSQVTDVEGTFVFDALPPGSYTVEFNRIGYRKATSTVSMTSTGVRMDVVLRESALDLPAVTITAEAQPAPIRDVPLPAGVLAGETLERERGQSLGETIVSLPGVNGFSGGPLEVKPVVRGLSGQRALVLSNGVRLESQTWDEPQSPEIDVLDVKAIEVVRGPVSMLYGSDALGGVVNTIRYPVPSTTSGSPTLEGTAMLNVFSGNEQAAGGLAFSGATGDFGYRGNVTARTAGDYFAPAGITANGTHAAAGRVFNTGAREIDGSLTFGWRRSWGTFVLDATHFGQSAFIAPEPGRLEYEYNVNSGAYDSLPASPHQEILHENVSVLATFPSRIARFEIRAGYQRNERREEGVTESEEDEQKKEALGIKPEADLVLQTLAIDARAHHEPIGPLVGTVGISASTQMNGTDGIHAIIPGYSTRNVAAFISEILHVGDRLRLSGGARADLRSMHVDKNAELGNAAATLDYHAVTGSVGFTWNLADPVTLAANVGRGWRSPVAAELFFHGADEGAVRYKLGDAGLLPEESLGLDAALRFSVENVTAEFDAFRNRVARFIHLSATGQKIDGLDSYRYTQSDAVLYGGEFSVHAMLLPWLTLGVTGDLVRGSNVGTDVPLPFMPADRIAIGLRMLRDELWGAREIGWYVRTRLVARQDHVDARELPTPSFVLWETGISADVPALGTSILVDVSCENLFDRAYFDHLSRYKAYALDPGRNVSLRVHVPFLLLH